MKGKQFFTALENPCYFVEPLSSATDATLIAGESLGSTD